MLKNLILTDADTISLKRTNYSLTKLLKSQPGPLSDEEIAKVLLLDEEEVNELYNEIVEKLRGIMKVK